MDLKARCGSVRVQGMVSARQIMWAGRSAVVAWGGELSFCTVRLSAVDSDPAAGTRFGRPQRLSRRQYCDLVAAILSLT